MAEHCPFVHVALTFDRWIPSPPFLSSSVTVAKQALYAIHQSRLFTGFAGVCVPTTPGVFNVEGYLGGPSYVLGIRRTGQVGLHHFFQRGWTQLGALVSFLQVHTLRVEHCLALTCELVPSVITLVLHIVVQLEGTQVTVMYKHEAVIHRNLRNTQVHKGSLHTRPVFRAHNAGVKPTVRRRVLPRVAAELGKVLGAGKTEFKIPSACADSLREL
mmetsp:Transcript_16088/g.23635  ORF Transcript_16088/g.23635 Transcript_16088/m.23635 type:complete len:215 (-) Transcript_16088:360-1004(-)